jgi:hypothetical protein
MPRSLSFESQPRPAAPARRLGLPKLRLAAGTACVGLALGGYFWVPSTAGQRWVCGHNLTIACTTPAKPAPAHRPAAPHRTPED